MIRNKKIIGVCMTRIHDLTRATYIDYLHKHVVAHGHKMIIFNSFLDYYQFKAFDEGARAVYDIINYDIIDVLIIYVENFYDRGIVDKIVERAKEKSVPVILLNEKREGCYSVMSEYEKPFKDIIRHVVKEHGATDTYFMAGRKEGDVISEYRIKCYKEVLEENGIAFREDRIGYGNYWGQQAQTTFAEFLDREGKAPQAVICANDYMAYSICNLLEERGYNVPKDVIVTGFDGVPSTKYCSPLLTTCEENLEGLAEKSIEVVEIALKGEKPGCVLESVYFPIIAESCGCEPSEKMDLKKTVTRLDKTITEMGIYEEYMYTWIDRMLGIKDMNDLYQNLAECILKNSYVCLCNDFVATSVGNNMDDLENKISDELLVISPKGDDKKTGKLLLKDMVPEADDWIKDDTMFVLTVVHSGKEICGYYAVKTNDIIKNKHKIKRISKSINVACDVSVNYLRQMKLKISVESAATTNHITKLPNLKGSVKWFEEFSAVEENHQKALSISVYGLPKYTYIYENYGIEDIEEMMHFVAESLKISNPTDCFIGQVADDEFVIVNYYDDVNKIGDTINNATSVFFSVIEGYNSNSDKEYNVEVNCGCTVVYAGWNEPLEAYVKFANGEMYMNRLKTKMGSAVKEQVVPKEHYKALELLIKKNLFHYHFQPIVDIKTGEIYAYEALMRTDPSIGMNPLEVLNVAREYNYLYEIERLCLFNIMECYAREREKFGTRRIFINTIPGHFLKDDDIVKLMNMYGDYMNYVVFELTEQNSVSDEELNSIRNMSGETGVGQIAIDDYGTGYSNIVNLMRYSPQIIKIDRFLVADIHTDQNKQMFVKSTIDFARLNDIKVLAEGVETSDELRMVITLGVDYVQGYYTGRPVAEPIPVIAENIRKEIEEANQLIL